MILILNIFCFAVVFLTFSAVEVAFLTPETRECLQSLVRVSLTLHSKACYTPIGDTRIPP